MLNRTAERVIPSFAARQMGYDTRNATHLSGRGLEEISSALGQKPQPRIKQLYCHKASGYPECFTRASSRTYTSLERPLHFSLQRDLRRRVASHKTELYPG